MKAKLLALLICCAPLFLFAQSKSDTLKFLNHLGKESYKITNYSKAGNLEKTTFTSSLETEHSKEELFMKGVKVADVNQKSNLVDSVFLYSENGKLDQKKIYNHNDITTFDYEYDDNWNLQRIVKNKGHEYSKIHVFGDGELELNRSKEIIEGRIGEIINYAIPIKFLKGKKAINLSLRERQNDIKLVEHLKLKDDSEGEIKLEIKFSTQIVQTEIILENGEGEIAKLPIEIIGYDLFFDDFKEKNQSIEVLELSNRKKIIIKSDGNEKLLRLYHKKELIDNYPISQMRSNINVKGFKKGVYLLESIDLGNNDKKYYQISLN